MTTKVTIETTPSWPVKIEPVDPVTHAPLGGSEVVPPNSTRTMYLHAGQSLLLTEVQPTERTIPEPADDQPLVIDETQQFD